jgi:hypothetical protein
MEEQKVIITTHQSDINDWLDKGWNVKSVTPQHVSTGHNGHLYGNFLVVLAKTGIKVKTPQNI